MEQKNVKGMKSRNKLKVKIIQITSLALFLFVILSAIVSYIFYNDAIAMNPSVEFKATTTQFFVIYLCAEFVAALIIECIIVSVFNSNIIVPIQKLIDALFIPEYEKVNLSQDLDTIMGKIEQIDIPSDDEIDTLRNSIYSCQLDMKDYITDLRDDSWEEEHDSMTMLANRIKYDKDIIEKYDRANSVYLARLDVVNMSIVNEKISIEAGDSIISKVARELRRLNSDEIHTYRLEEDHFLIVLTNYTEEEAKSIMNKWMKRVGRLNRASDSFECRLVYGGAYGENKYNIDLLYESAEQDMFENKSKIKEKK